MKLDIIVGVVLSAAIHGGVLFASYLTKKEVVVAAVEEEETVIEIMQMPIIEPDEPDVPPDEAPPEEIEYVPPQQADVPTASIDSAFTQQIQPPPPSMQRPSGQMAIPAVSTAKAASGMKDLFDLANLDQVPQPRYQAQPQYPFEMRRAGITGEVVVGFIVDSQGKAIEVYAVRSTQREFEAAAIQAVGKWTFRPGRKGGRAVNTRMQVPIVFSLNDR
jgi:periplasmic protein TonB